MKNPILKTAFALVATVAVTPQIAAAPSSKTSQMQMSQTKPLPFDTIPALGGVIKITPILHASIQIEYRGKVILVDPISAGSYRKKADLILITHSHGDHFDSTAIKRVNSPFMRVVAPKSVADELRPLLPPMVEQNPNHITTLANGHTININTNDAFNKFVIRVQAVPAYNLVRGPKPGQKFHPKGDGNSYILTLGGKRIYIAGDTEATPEMKALKNIDAAFIPMNLPYTMTPQEAAVGVRAFKPKVVYPYHFRFPFDKPNTNPQQFAYALRDTKTQVRVLDWYNSAPVARFMKAMKKG